MKQFTRVEPDEVQVCGGKYKRQTVIKRFQTEDGKLHEFTTWGLAMRSGAVIAITPHKQVITTYQFRAGPERWMYELPGGGVHDGEDPQAGVLRELREETGYEPGHVEFLGSSVRDAYINGDWFYYLATDCTVSKSGPQMDAEEHDQGAEVRLISIAELIENAKKGNMTDPVAVLLAYEKLQELQYGAKNN